MKNKKNKIQRKERDKLKNMSSLIQVNLNESQIFSGGPTL